VRSDPLEDVRHLLEQAAIHPDPFRFKLAAQDRFPGSDPATPSGFDRLTDPAGALAKCDTAAGLTFGQVLVACEDDPELARRAMAWLQKNGVGWSQGETLFPLSRSQRAEWAWVWTGLLGNGQVR
jgi:hypothetical protein